MVSRVYVTTGYLYLYPNIYRYVYYSIGFNLNGNPNTTCKSDLQWSSPAFFCVKKDCGQPEAIENGYFEAKDTKFGAWAIYKCNEGEQWR